MEEIATVCSLLESHDLSSLRVGFGLFVAQIASYPVRNVHRRHVV